MCQQLHLSYTELMQQPAEWVDASIEYLTQQAKYAEAMQKVEKARARQKRR